MYLLTCKLAQSQQSLSQVTTHYGIKQTLINIYVTAQDTDNG